MNPDGDMDKRKAYYHTMLFVSHLYFVNMYRPYSKIHHHNSNILSNLGKCRLLYALKYRFLWRLIQTITGVIFKILYLLLFTEKCNLSLVVNTTQHIWCSSTSPVAQSKRLTICNCTLNCINLAKLSNV